jgi:hypothetical protein
MNPDSQFHYLLKPLIFNGLRTSAIGIRRLLAGSKTGIQETFSHSEISFAIRKTNGLPGLLCARYDQRSFDAVDPSGHVKESLNVGCIHWFRLFCNGVWPGLRGYVSQFKIA